MEFYLDLYFLVNGAMDFLMLLLLKKMMKSPAGLFRLFGGSAAGAAASCLAVLQPGLSWFPVLLLEVFAPAVLMVWIAFRPRVVGNFLKYLLVLFLEAFLLGGVMEAMYQRMAWAGGQDSWGLSAVWFPFMAFLGGGLVWILWDWGFAVRRQRRMLWNVTLQNGIKNVSAVGYLDTGNRLREPESGKPVHILSKELWDRLGEAEEEKDLPDRKKTTRIPFHTIGNALGFLEVMELDAMELKEPGGSIRRLEKPFVARAPNALCQDGSYDILLHEETELSEE